MMLGGRDLLLKVETANTDGDVTLETVAGLRAKSLVLNARPVDITDAGSAGWREMLPGAGIRSAEIAGSGIFRSAQSDTRLRTAFFTQSAIDCTFLLPGFGKVVGAFLLTRLKYAGSYDGEAAFEMTFTSAGEVMFEALL